MAANKKSTLGKSLVVIGGAWFLLDFFWLPPGVLLLGGWKLSEVSGHRLLRAEFAISAAIAGIGILLWRRATRKLSIADYIIVFAGVSIPVFAAFQLYGL